MKKFWKYNLSQITSLIMKLSLSNKPVLLSGQIVSNEEDLSNYYIL